MSGAATAKMVIEIYEDRTYCRKTGQHAMLFNPESYALEWDFVFEQEQFISGKTRTSGLLGINRSLFDLTLLLDGTGVGAAALGKSGVDVPKELWEFLETATVLNRDGTRKPAPPFCRLVWGNLCARCVVKKVRVEASLVAADGKILRAALHTTFQSVFPKR